MGSAWLEASRTQGLCVFLLGQTEILEESCCFVFPSSTKREFRHFHVVVGQRRQRNVQKKRDARAKLLFCLSKPIAFLPFSLPSASSFLRLPNVNCRLLANEKIDSEYNVMIVVFRVLFSIVSGDILKELKVF